MVTATKVGQLRVFADDCFLAPSWQSVSRIKSGEIFRSYSDIGNTHPPIVSLPTVTTVSKRAAKSIANHKLFGANFTCPLESVAFSFVEGDS